jgi:hypothetical protein
MNAAPPFLAGAGHERAGSSAASAVSHTAQEWSYAALVREKNRLHDAIASRDSKPASSQTAH